ncbi:PREDICTED: uncharacterized protein LOC108662429 [Theobroma cacao]|uniref:Uncharacterized protein LOC108662429 n=1 Tax=Theobroma cacao TaxID=3641 RepID=A0AB32WG30_THECC|nr:PREDICTED: uncharacterized protein LOC108662429 [Theobroma cacao]
MTKLPLIKDIGSTSIYESIKQIQELQEQLARRDAQINNSNSSDEENDTNPFHQNLSSDEEVPIRRLRTTAARDLRIKIDIPEFEGRLHPDDFLDWLYTVERVFELKDIPDEKRVKLVAIKLKKHASIWWENLKRQREREGRNKIRTWDKMRRELKRKFLLEHYRQEIFIKFHNLRQKTMTVEEYTMEFEQLHIKCDVHEPEEQIVARYLEGLNVEIADVVQLQPYWNLNDVIRLALKVEKQQSRKRSMSSSRQQESISNDESQSSVTIPPPKVNSSKAASSNDKKTTFTRASNVNKKCFKCQGFGHIASDCPNRRIISLVEEEDYVNWEKLEPVYDEYDDEEIEKVSADHGEALIVRRNLNTALMTKDESWLRHNIFYTRCTSQGKVCNVIIDSGSCENVVANYMVEKLKLPTEVHPHPYKLQWLRKGNDIKVTKHYCVQFSIGNKYEDEVWCDVIPMDACHLLLGRPWQYDRRAHYDGYNNTYSFIKDGVKIMLTPLKPEDRPKRQEEDKALITVPSLSKAYCESNHLCLLLVSKENKVSSSLSNDGQTKLINQSSGNLSRSFVDNHAVNKTTVKYDFPSPRLDDMFIGSKVFLKMDLKKGYQQIRIRLGDEWKTTFKTMDELIKCLVWTMTIYRSRHQHGVCPGLLVRAEFF